ncbi:AraC family transcriptional regulator [Ktedonospora formicarum]|uniref:AraC family transcriptional regulator n=1 Tax=Ktedonospora formicarum TaxID=2778364 RepID=A0A8J3MRT5_9CHLR|nr:AraC family transcriptional regulator [Ktedonospora formicarum]GHO42605.1 AraC family transcriptional regulator [Ktedonospora formicarum]
MYPPYTSEQGRSSADWSIASRQQMALSLTDPFFCELLFDQLADIVFFVKDVQGRYLVVNTTLMRRCGCKEKRDLIGRSPLEVFPPELGASYLAQDRQVVCQGQAIYNRLELHLYNDRSRGWCLTHKIPLLDKDEQITGVTGISRDLRVPDQGHPVYQRLAEVIAYIQQAYAQPIRLEHLAAIANLSVAQLERHIQRIFDLTPKQLLIKTRLEAATRLLEGADSISSIAHACGYADHSAFSRQFRTVVGISPAKYREMLRVGS